MDYIIIALFVIQILFNIHFMIRIRKGDKQITSLNDSLKKSVKLLKYLMNKIKNKSNPPNMN